jgi:hypothetical protein
MFTVGAALASWKETIGGTAGLFYILQYRLEGGESQRR